ncbi:unnamed protein product [Tilletia controversa]|uniref:Uncharacterized protein n=3 Tax=Tilletia TaxID=13289 RepID=A0A8X7N1N6_9BASI|nr:hypothetical protein CF335_g7241 [Tilletia laevis]KAE8197143.1 hypothetical protein CF328_g3937 [Tilletia controversa]KAE8263725.1 hypothetical protein A4X03_0g1471 [Tilletia caries]KAE8192901.1 hypothetical protein CF336_g4224 [Tilletia laevis]KAE8255747.1 hypothetical protein A4X06_0g284 [Tilletia controversa]
MSGSSSNTRTPRKTLAGSPLVRSVTHRLAGRASDSFLAQRPPSSSAASPSIPRSPSTPYHQFAAAQRSRLGPRHQNPTSSPFSIAADTSAYSLDDSYASGTSSPAFRKGSVQGFVSAVKPRTSMSRPGIVTVRGAGRQSTAQDEGAAQPSSSSPKRPRHVRRTPLSQKLKQYPVDLMHTLYLRYMVDFSPSQIIFETSPTLPIVLGALLHLISLIACVFMNPSAGPSAASVSSSVSAGMFKAGAAVAGGGSGGAKAAGGGSGKPALFRQSGNAAERSSRSQPPPMMGHVPDSAIPDLRSLARARHDDWMRWTSILLTLALLLAATGIAYKLFTTTRKYTFWMRTEFDTLRSSRVKLVTLPLDEDVEPLPLKERVRAWAMSKLRGVPVLGWFLGEEEVVASAGETKMYSLETWDPPTMLLRLFCIYSPLHAFLWSLSSPLFPSTSSAASVSLLSRFFALVLWPALHIAVGAQLFALVHFFQTLVQDRTLVQSEAMHEYDEKFVFARAMPMMCNASTMTNEAETIDLGHQFRGGVVMPLSLRMDRKASTTAAVGREKERAFEDELCFDGEDDEDEDDEEEDEEEEEEEEEEEIRRRRRKQGGGLRRK